MTPAQLGKFSPASESYLQKPSSTSNKMLYLLILRRSACWRMACCIMMAIACSFSELTISLIGRVIVTGKIQTSWRAPALIRLQECHGRRRREIAKLRIDLQWPRHPLSLKAFSILILVIGFLAILSPTSMESWWLLATPITGRIVRAEFRVSLQLALEIAPGKLQSVTDKTILCVEVCRPVVLPQKTETVHTTVTSLWPLWT